jgi:hypothetical protein
MGTNFYRIPTENEMKARKERLLKHINKMELTPDNIESEFHYISAGESFSVASPWGIFIDDMKIHLGKRSSGWKFTWNFHNNKYYSNKEELFEFIRSGRVVDEYGTEIEVEEFIKMALEWGEPDGHVLNADYVMTHMATGLHCVTPKEYDRTIDGLNVSSHTEFC